MVMNMDVVLVAIIPAHYSSEGHVIKDAALKNQMLWFCF